MKLLAVCVVWVLAFFCAATDLLDTPTEIVFGPDEEFRYRYDGHVVTGIPNTDYKFSGLRLKCQAQIRFHPRLTALDELTATVQLYDVALHKVFGDLSNVPFTSERLPDEHPAVIPVPCQQASDNICQLLATPFTFRYKNGLVTSIDFTQNDDSTSRNLKRGILNLLQIDTHPSSTDHVYNVDEADILGRCTSSYVIHRDAAAPYWEATKVRLWDTCEEEYVHNTGLFAGVLRHDEAKAFSHPEIRLNMKLWGDRAHFMVKQSTLSSTFMATPMSANPDSMAAFIRQELTHLSTSPQAVSPIPSLTSLSTVSLKMDITTPSAPSENRPLTFDVPSGELPPNWFQKVDSWLTTAVSTPARSAQHLVTSALQDLTRALQKCTRDELILLFSRYTALDATTTGKREVLLDVVPVLGSEAVPHTVAWLINNSTVTGLRAAALVDLMALTTPQPDSCITVMLNLVELPWLRRDDFVFRASVLAIGVMGNRLSNMPTQTSTLHSRSSTMENIISVLRRKFDAETDIGVRTAVVKALGNLGWTSSFTMLRDIILDHTHPTILRSQATYALRKLSTQHFAREEITDLLLPCFANTLEDVEIRIACFLMLLKTNPDDSTMVTIGHLLENEPELQIQTLVYSTLKNLANSEPATPDKAPLIEICRQILMWIKPVSVRPFDSQNVHIRFASELLDLSGSLDFDLVKSSHTVLPQSFVTYIKAIRSNTVMSLAEFGITSKGLETIIHTLLSTPDEPLRHLFTPPFISLTSFLERLQTLFNNMPLADHSGIDFQALAYFKLLGYDLQYLTIDKYTFMEFIEHCRNIAAAGDFRLLKSVPLLFPSLFPTPLGLPLCLDRSLLPVAVLEGGLYTGGFSEWIRGQRAAELSLVSNLTVQTHVNLNMRLQTELQDMTAGTEVGMSIFAFLPLKGGVRISPSNGNIATTLDASKSLLVNASIEPTVFFTEPSTDDPTSQVTSLLPLTTNSPSHSHTTQWRGPELLPGFRPVFTSKHHISAASTRDGVRVPLLAPHSAEMTLNSSLPTVVQLQTSLGTGWMCSLVCDQPSRFSRVDPHVVLEAPFTPVAWHPLMSISCPPVQLPFTLSALNNSPVLRGMFVWTHTPDWLKHHFNMQTITRAHDDSFSKKMDIFINRNRTTWTGPEPEPALDVALISSHERFAESTVTFKLHRSEVALPRTETASTCFKSYSNQLNDWHSWIETFMTFARVTHFLLDDDDSDFSQTCLPIHFCFDGSRNQAGMTVTIPERNADILDHTSFWPNQIPTWPEARQEEAHRFPLWGECSLTSDNVRTFDGKLLAIPEDFGQRGCRVIMSKDVSPHMLYTLTVSLMPSYVGIELQLPYNALKVTPRTSSRLFQWIIGTSLEVTVNNETVSLTPGVPREVVLTPDPSGWFRLTKDQGNIVITATSLGLRVVTDGQTVMLTVPPWLQGLVTGPCGNFDGEPNNDWSEPSPGQPDHQYLLPHLITCPHN